MRASVVILLLFCGCMEHGNEGPQGVARSSLLQVGILEDPALVEASGLARSQRDPDLLWIINDGGAKPRIHAIDRHGTSRGVVSVAGARNVDWEDLASFRWRGAPYLLIADIGDNDARRDMLSLYVIEEPDLKSGSSPKVRPKWRIDFMYPNGARDAEAIAVDAVNERVFVLTKRDIPAVLYELPLVPQRDDILTATRVGTIGSLPAPRARDVENAPVSKDWYWQPTAMDIAADNLSVLVLTYRAVYVYLRNVDETWFAALSRQPLVIGLGDYREAEAAAFGADGTSIFVTVEQQHAPLLRIDLNGETAE
ncbi:MAG: hypothetical protein IIA78_05395 [Proteobacteria bacterium]|nr:hypothetical protein [Pseudomonadota bacterium]